MPASTKGFMESSNETRVTAVSPSLLHAKEQISHETMQNYYVDDTFEWKMLKMEQQTDSKGGESEVATGCMTDGDSTSTNNHENTPHRNTDYLVNFVLSIFFFNFILYINLISLGRKSSKWNGINRNNRKSDSRNAI